MGPAGVRGLFAGTVFSGAFLLFLVQPLIAKQILPWFGGSAAVWSVCLVFFQVALLAGYAYADFVTRRLRLLPQVVLHAALLAASLAFLPILAAPHWKPAGTEMPALHILGLLLATLGLPYFLLSSTGPLVQSWVARTPFGAQVYRYFSLSNLASLASLLAYPLLIEPFSPLRTQAVGWSVGYVVFVLLCTATALATAWGERRGAWGAAAPAAAPEGAAAASLPPLARQLWWLALPALGCGLLLSVTNHITQNVAAVPFLWVLPLSVYLLSFVLTFESDRWYRRRLFLPLGALALVGCAFGLQDEVGVDLRSAIPLYVAGLFVLCMCLHGETARLRPAPGGLTRFYLMLSLGGALGGAAVGLLAPVVLPAYYELGLGLVLVALLAAALPPAGHWPARAAALTIAALCAVLFGMQVRDDTRDARVMTRNFYGTLLTADVHRDAPADDVRQMYHGAIKHGEQYLAAARRREPTAYYGRSAGIGRALMSVPAGPRRVGLIGLGAGTLAAYGRPGDLYRVYDINPEVFVLADREFSFLADSPARIERVLGDARLALEREAPQGYDVLAVDAFSGDSVPIHLITLEALDVYLRHLAPGGLVAFHVTNRFLALAPVVEQVARQRGLAAVLVHDEAEHDPYLRPTDWVLVSRDAVRLSTALLGAAPSPIAPVPGLAAWTDDFNNLFGVLK